MKAAILAGGRGTRLYPDTVFVPKPMVEVGGKPMLWHIMRGYASFGVDHFAIALGYRGDVIKRYMTDYQHLNSDLTVEIGTGNVTPHGDVGLAWRVDLVETGLHAETGARLRKLRPYLTDDAFMLTYGDGVSDVDVSALISFHRSHRRIATLTAVRPPARFGHLEIEGEQVVLFSEKVQTTEGWINGGFFVFDRAIFDAIPAGDDVSLERDVLPAMAREGQLAAYLHEGFWKCMDTSRDREALEQLWAEGKAAWKLWR